MTNISEEAIFCFDLIAMGFPLCKTDVGLYVCKPCGENWLNATLVKVIQFPDRELDGSETASSYTKIWVEPSDWYSLNKEPNIPQDSAYDFLFELLVMCRQSNNDEMAKLISICSGKKYSEAKKLFEP